MRTQDLKYISMKRVIERNKINRLKSQLHFIDEAKEINNQHIHFEEPSKKSKAKSKKQIVEKELLDDKV